MHSPYIHPSTLTFITLWFPPLTSPSLHSLKVRFVEHIQAVTGPFYQDILLLLGDINSLGHMLSALRCEQVNVQGKKNYRNRAPWQFYWVKLQTRYWLKRWDSILLFKYWCIILASLSDVLDWSVLLERNFLTFGARKTQKKQTNVELKSANQHIRWTVL